MRIREDGRRERVREMEGKEKTDGCGAGGKMLAAGVSIGAIHHETFFLIILLTLDNIYTKLIYEFYEI